MKKIWLAMAGVVALLATLFLAGCGASFSPSTVNVVSQSQGIWVSGEGKVTVTPDLAIISIGVQDRKLPWKKLTLKPQDAMDNVIKALKDNGMLIMIFRPAILTSPPVTR